MRESPPVRRPALPVSCSLLAGIAAAPHLPPVALVSAWNGAALSAVVLWIPMRRGRAALAAAALAAGLWAGSLPGNRAEPSWIPRTGAPVQMHLVGIALSSPEPGTGGDWILIVRGTPEREKSGPATVRLRVAASPPGPTRRLTRIRRGDHLRIWCRVRIPVPKLTDGQRDPGPRLRAEGLDAVGSVKSARLIERIGSGTGGIAHPLDGARAWARNRLDLALGPGTRERALVGAMLLGDRGALEPRDRRVLRDAGLLHLTAISGLHVGLVAWFLLALAARRHGGPVVEAGLVVPAVVVLAVTVGSRPPVLRAALCVALVLAGRTTGRSGESLNTLVLVAALLAAARPALTSGAAFQLTFLATAGIVLLTRPLASAIPLPRFASLGAGVSLVAYLATAPVAAWHFGRVAPVAILSNVVAAPLCAAVLLGGFLCLPFAGVPVAGAPARAATHALFSVAAIASRVPLASFPVHPPTFPVLALHYGALAATAGLARPWGRRARAAAGLIVMLALSWIHLGPPPPRFSGGMEIRVLDVGQAQAILVRGPSGECLLLDAAGTSGGRFDAGERIVSPAVEAAGCSRLDVVVATHAHDDHAGGIPAILRDWDVGELWVGAGVRRDRRTRALVRLARNRRVAVVLAVGGVRLRRAGLEVEVLHPPRGFAGDPNDLSVVLRIAGEGHRVLVPGDLQASGERDLLKRGADLRSEVLVVDHHGSRGGSTEPFLKAVGPAIALISAGRGNRFGHPHGSVLLRLRRRHAAILRTDRHGTLFLRAGPGEGWSWRTFRQRRWIRVRTRTSEPG